MCIRSETDARIQEFAARFDRGVAICVAIRVARNSVQVAKPYCGDRAVATFASYGVRPDCNNYDRPSIGYIHSVSHRGYNSAFVYVNKITHGLSRALSVASVARRA